MKVSIKKSARATARRQHQSMRFSQLAFLFTLACTSVEAFVPTYFRTGCGHQSFSASGNIEQQLATALMAKGEGKKKRRRRKTSTIVPPPMPVTDEPMPIPEGSKVSSGEDLPSIDELKSIASFDPKSTTTSSFPPATVVGNTQQPDDTFSELVELPDIRDALKRKELKKVEEEEKEKNARPKISRKDRKAMLQVRM